MSPSNVIDQALEHIRTADSKFATFLRDAPDCVLAQPLHESDFETLIFAVIGQQVSAKAADSMRLRLLEQTGRPLLAEHLLNLGHDGLREFGFTRAKSRTMVELCEALLAGQLDFAHMRSLDDSSAVAYLSQFWGIGRWTSEMLMIFRMGRLDLWPTGDLGVRRGWSIIQGLDEIPSPAAMENAADHLRPYRSVVAWYCWVATREDSKFW